MSDDISQSVSQRVNGAYDEENLRIQEVSNELQRLCRLHEEESGNGKVIGKHGAVSAIPRPRNVLVDKDGDMYVIDAEIAKRS